ncbi:hypothetical protein [Frischella perrara]|uniref:hypothetical protein n=1 Tax=Frischella perrara TaxID=1267021 RepID=UPI0023F44AE6|nr:hypothetical protein [Frischella perrara]
MKKIFLVGLISLFLSGCDKTVSDEVVSDKMFIGDWKCNYIDYKSIWDGNNFGEYKIDEKFEVLVTFKYENNSLYSKITNKDEWTKRSLVEEYNNKTIQDEDGFLKMKVTKSLKKVSDDKFITTDECEFISKDEEYDSFNRKFKNEITCTRIR